MRSILIAALAAFAFASVADAAATAPYKLDAKGKCHGSNGQFAKQSLCGGAPVVVAKTTVTKTTTPAATTTTTTTSKKCKDPKTKKFAKCTAPGAVPA